MLRSSRLAHKAPDIVLEQLSRSRETYGNDDKEIATRKLRSRKEIVIQQTREGTDDGDRSLRTLRNCDVTISLYTNRDKQLKAIIHQSRLP